MRSRWTLAWIALCLAACQQPSAPLATPSGEQLVFAERYPGRLAKIRVEVGEEEEWVRGSFERSRAFARKLNKADFNRVIEVMTLADSSGRSSAYADQALAAEAIARFMGEEKAALRQNVSGAIAYTSKEGSERTTWCTKECTDAMAPVAISAMERAVDRQANERLERASEAMRYVEDHKEELGRQNLALIDKQVRDTTRASFVVHIRLELYRRELEGLLAEASTVRTTLDRAIEDANAELADGATPKVRQAAVRGRVEAVKKPRAELDPETERANAALNGLSDQIQALQKDYRAAFDAMIAELDVRAREK